jgi:hypothetical protein
MKNYGKINENEDLHELTIMGTVWISIVGCLPRLEWMGERLQAFVRLVPCLVSSAWRWLLVPRYMLCCAVRR